MLIGLDHQNFHFERKENSCCFQWYRAPTQKAFRQTNRNKHNYLYLFYKIIVGFLIFIFF